MKVGARARALLFGGPLERGGEREGLSFLSSETSPRATDREEGGAARSRKSRCAEGARALCVGKEHTGARGQMEE